MALVELSAAAFALLNAGKVVGYVPQFLRIYRDRGGAAAVSLGTWLIFTASNGAIVAYALAHSGDLVIAAVFGVNAVSCLLIACLTWMKRQAHRSRLAAAPATIAGRPALNLALQSEATHVAGARSPARSPRQ